MKIAAGVGLAVLFVVGAVVGIAIGVAVFFVSLVRGKRAVHADGIVCRAEITERDAAGACFAGPVQLRLSGAFESEDSTSDVLGMTLRIAETQDLLVGTFESFLTAKRDRENTIANDFLANQYASVTPWWVPGGGVAYLRLVPIAQQPPGRGESRLARLDADLAAGTARMTLALDVAGGRREVAELRILARETADAPRLRASMFRTGRAVRPLGLRNGIRATVYPLSQTARALRGG